MVSMRKNASKVYFKRKVNRNRSGADTPDQSRGLFLDLFFSFLYRNFSTNAE